MVEIIYPVHDALPGANMENTKIIIDEHAGVASVSGIFDWIQDSKAGDSACYFFGDLSCSLEISENKKEIGASSSYAWTMMNAGLINLVRRIGPPRPSRQNVAPRSFFYIMQRTKKSAKHPMAIA